MNIYFCGIGGVGLGPLAEIALDAGYTVTGSDQNETLMSKRLRERGVKISDDQSGVYLDSVHNHDQIDWFIHTSAIPEDHTELKLAKQLGIKISKRDELLSEIIKQKNLRLIGVTGTHGKTTTTAMTVWTMKQLGIPVSYSIGSTLPFGPSGHYQPGSQYFVYECDEFDKNFLQFNPDLALITSIDYDHPDTYPTPEEYITAFRQFTKQSGWTILWQNDANLIGDNLIGELPRAWILGEHDIADVQLSGEHNRRNASLVVKAMEKLEIMGDAVAAVSSYPGSDRRFEKLADNLYSDYGHHPNEVAATLQMARELNNDVVLVYQPHQNVRQHELRPLYTDCFEQANDIFWLPTYLTREDKSLPVFTPQELTRDVTNSGAVHFADLNDELWDNIVSARQRGALVLCMGAGSIDEWVRARLKD